VASASAGAAGPLRVGFLLDRWDPTRGGAERAMADLARHLEARGHRVLAVAAEHTLDAPGEPVEVVTRGWTRAARARHLARALPEAARTAGCDVTVGMRHLERVDLYWPHDGAHAASLAARREARGRPPTAPPRGRHALFVELERRLLEQGGARSVACVSQLVRDELAALHPAGRERLVLVPNGVDLERFHPRRRAAEGAALRAELGLPAEAPLLVFAGADGRRKGLAQLLAALAGLCDLRWTLLVAGVRHPAGWARVARGHALEESRVRLVDPQPAPRLWAAADLCVLPTWRDACGLVVLEALASGVPVVTTARAGAAEALRGRDAGTVLERPGDVRALRGALQTWLQRLPAWGAAGRAAARACVTDRDRGAWMAHLERLVLELARAPRSARPDRSGGAGAR
jgi:UDP-glucose:(heptosyl)LPS alpha-1,3-glucosyltransferase